jgi:hypothetical protein
MSFEVFKSHFGVSRPIRRITERQLSFALLNSCCNSRTEKMLYSVQPYWRDGEYGSAARTIEAACVRGSPLSLLVTPLLGGRLQVAFDHVFETALFCCIWPPSGLWTYVFIRQAGRVEPELGDNRPSIRPNIDSRQLG